LKLLICIFEKINVMSVNKSELLALPAKEKIELAEELWGSVEDELMPMPEEIQFAEERLQLHLGTPKEGLTVEEFKKYFAERHGL
jgi:putative addiction module component (TIGR02574 family)